MKNAPMQSVLTLAIELWTFKSPGELPSPHLLIGTLIYIKNFIIKFIAKRTMWLFID
jgi:hypothetical protein